MPTTAKLVKYGIRIKQSENTCGMKELGGFPWSEGEKKCHDTYCGFNSGAKCDCGAGYKVADLVAELKDLIGKSKWDGFETIPFIIATTIESQRLANEALEQVGFTKTVAKGTHGDDYKFFLWVLNQKPIKTRGKGATAA